jgi:hypothetical protein
MSVLDLLGELGTLDPWLYRGWAYLFSGSYRESAHSRWRKGSRLAAFADIFLSLAVMGFEVFVIVGVVFLALA